MSEETSFISSKEHLNICLELHRDPSLTLEKIESLITSLQEEIFESEKVYLRELDNKQYQKTLIERKGAKENNNHFITLFGHLDEEIKTLISEHNEKMDKLRADLLYRKKMKKIYVEMYPPAQRSLLSPRTTSPRITSGNNTPRGPRSTNGVGASTGSTESLGGVTPPKTSPRMTNELASSQEHISSPHLSPRNSYSKDRDREDSSNPGSATSSPRITRLLKSNSFLKRSMDLVMKAKSSS